MRVRGTMLVIATVGAATLASIFIWRTARNTDGERRTQWRGAMVGRGDLNTLDPALAGTEAPTSIVWNVYDRLVQLGSDGTLAGVLARRWSHSDDLMEWRFELADGPTFDGAGPRAGSAVTGMDVKYSIERAVRIPGYGRSLVQDVLLGVDEFLAGNVSTISGISASDREVVFNLKTPFAFFPDRLATSFMSVVPLGTPDNAELPPGTGAFRVDNWDRNTNEVVLKRRDHLWHSLPDNAPTRLDIKTIEYEGLAVSELRAGNLDWVDGGSTLRSAIGQADDSVAICPFDATELRLVAFNMNASPFNGDHSVKLRQALNLSINRLQIVSALGGGEELCGPVPAWRGSSLSFDPQQAETLLRDVPAADRQLTLLVEPADEAELIAQYLAQQWQAAGLAVTALPGRADFYDRIVSGDYQMALAYYGPFVPSAEQYVWVYRANAIPVPNVMRYHNPIFESAFGQYASAADVEVRNRGLQMMVESLLADPPVGWVVKPPRFTITTKRYLFQRSAGLPDFSAPRPR